MKLITTDESLRRFLPNTFDTVEGETPLIEKLEQQLQLAENWVAATFTSDEVLDGIAENQGGPLYLTAAQLVVAQALITAIPSLDLVLTPNGFGVVSNTNVAPASKERVERLIASLYTLRDNCIATLLQSLAAVPLWLDSQQAAFFSATLFPDLGIVDAIGHTAALGPKWERYLALRPQIINIEQSLSEDWVSPGQMDAFRSSTLTADFPSSLWLQVIRIVKGQVVYALKGMPISTRAMMDAVNTMRNHPDEFSLWVESDTAKLFSPPVFENKKQSNGYWF